MAVEVKAAALPALSVRVVAAVVGGLEGEAVAVAAAAPQPRGALGVLVAVALPWGRSRGAEA